MRTLQFISILTISLFLAAGPTSAQVVFGDPTNPTKATAINNLEVGGAQYDVVFQLQMTAAVIYGDYPGTFTINTIADAEAAVDAVNLALNGANATSIGNIDQPGIESNIYNIGYESFLLGEIESVNVWRAISETGSDWMSLGQNPWTYNLDERSWAVFSITTALDDYGNADIPQAYKLFPNYPNPFNPTTKITYNLPKAATVYLTIYNMLGQEARTLVNTNQVAGRYTVEWDGRDDSGKSIPSGIYVYTIKAGDFAQSRKMVLLK